MLATKQDAFVTPIWHARLPDTINTDWLIELAYNQRREFNTLNRCGSWQGFKADQMHELPFPAGIELQSFLDDLVNSIASEIGIHQFQHLLNYWLNINPPGGYNEEHKHPNALIVGNLYLKVPENSGNFVVHRDDTTHYHFFAQSSNPALSIRKEITPKDRDIILIPGWARHSVTLNNSKEDRIGFSFNYGELMWRNN